MQKFSKKKLYYGLAAGVVLAAVAAGIMIKGHSKSAVVMEEVALVRTAVVENAGAAQNYIYSGEVKGRFESQLAFQVGGKIIKRHVQLGSVVNAGDVLMEIDAKDVKQTVNSNAAQVYSAESQVKLAENNLNRYQKLYEGERLVQLNLINTKVPMMWLLQACVRLRPNMLKDLIN